MLYVAGEIFVWMALAFILGVLVGWFVWGLRQRKVAADKPLSTGAGRTAAAGAAAEVESVTVRPVIRPQAPPEPLEQLPPTPPAGTPAVPILASVPFAPPAAAEPEPSGDAPAEAPAPDPPEPTATPAREPETEPEPAPTSAGNVGLAALVTDDPAPPAASPDLAPTPAAGQAVTDLDAAVARFEDDVADAPDEDAALSVADELASAHDAAAGAHVAQVRATDPDLVAGAAVLGRPLASDDLKVVEGIGPRIEDVLKESGIGNWHDLAAASPERLRTILDLAGDQFRIHDPATWPHQAELAAAGRWDELVSLQASLVGGKHD